MQQMRPCPTMKASAVAMHRIGYGYRCGIPGTPIPEPRRCDDFCARTPPIHEDRCRRCGAGYNRPSPCSSGQGGSRCAIYRGPECPGRAAQAVSGAECGASAAHCRSQRPGSRSAEGDGPRRVCLYLLGLGQPMDAARKPCRLWPRGAQAQVSGGQARTRSAHHLAGTAAVHAHHHHAHGRAWSGPPVGRAGHGARHGRGRFADDGEHHGQSHD